MLPAATAVFLRRGVRFFPRKGAVRPFSIYSRELPRKVSEGRLTHYDVLHLDRDADTHQVKQAFLRLVKLYHPDTSRDPDTQAIFVCIKDAHETLSDPERRKVYDAGLARQDAPGADRPSVVRPVGRRGTGYDPSSYSEHDRERWERYNRYVNGERSDTGDRHEASKTFAALFISAATVLGLTLFAEEFFRHFKDVGTEDDDRRVELRQERLVKAYYNPLSERWERVIEPFAPPAPAALLRHHADLYDDFDEEQAAALLPKREFVVIETIGLSVCDSAVGALSVNSAIVRDAPDRERCLQTLFGLYAALACKRVQLAHMLSQVVGLRLRVSTYTVLPAAALRWRTFAVTFARRFGRVRPLDPLLYHAACSPRSGSPFADIIAEEESKSFCKNVALKQSEVQIRQARDDQCVSKIIPISEADVAEINWLMGGKLSGESYSCHESQLNRKPMCYPGAIDSIYDSR
ncbi:molecular chaperone [Babesia caballi]|uniref:Molecular chaperone n=1 Tax=Babesia caballi TaxID=5871 RepID=A0AAV4M2S1_BABCB|nr:molecular chaperone [Babesia caballi]